MKRLIVATILVLQTCFLYAQKEKKYVVQGNELYKQQKYQEAEKNYRKSLAVKGKLVEGNFNLGDALYKQKKFGEAGEQFGRIAAAAQDKNVQAQAFHNLGNSLLSSKKIQESIEAYKKALLNNPKDDQTRYNLAYAQQLLKNQQNKQNQNKQNQNKNKDQNKQDQKNKDQQDKNDQNKNKDQDKKDQQNGNQPRPDQLSKDEAERMLEALNNQERGTQDKLKNKKFGGAKGRITKDW
ncbi:tetratricopeptide repeat protein [Arcticibacter sp. MXS-1]|uniref:tetratricopeptide repeat protein n=1 Tax=Arcticibacter sp. MXS-1 TaxID=3341726 RepID=UPI0035A8B49B